MIAANELRIGNLHYYHIIDKADEREEWDEVSTIDAEDLVWLSKDGKNDPDYNPIPLSEEWLKRFGLLPHQSVKFLTVATPAYCQHKYSMIKIYSVTDDGDYILRYDKQDLTEVEYVHTLQNAYFALTGEELTITE